jgi:predicted nucleic acid-binding protein
MKLFIDSNIVLYLMDGNDHKRSIAQELLLKTPFINAQILTEVANVCRRRFNYNKEQILLLWSDLINDCNFIDTSKLTFQKSTDLVRKYDFQIFDALVVCSALEAKCDILYSEDMQHEMIVESKLKIVNPFR